MTDSSLQLPYPNRKPLLLVAATLLFILLALGLSWFLFLPHRLAATLQGNIRAHSGLKLDIAGASRMGFNNGLVIEFEDVSLDQPGAENAGLLRADRLILPVSVASVFGLAESERELHFENPVVSLAAQKLRTASMQEDERGAAIRETRPFKILVRNGAVNIDFGGGGLGLVATDLNGEISWTADDGLAAKLNGQFNGAATAFTFDVYDGWRALAGGSPVEISLATNKNQLAFSGRLKLADVLQLDGRVQGHGTSLGEFGSWLALGVSGFSTTGPLDFGGAVSLAGDVASFSGLDIAVSGMKATGSATVSKGSGRPQLDAKLNFDRLDVSAFSEVSAGKPNPLTEAWSERPLIADNLAALDADIAVFAKSLAFQGLKTGVAQFTFKLRDKKFEGAASVEKAGNGRVDLAFNLDGGLVVPELKVKLVLKDVGVGGLLANILGADGLDGLVNMAADVKARGLHVAGLISTLEGQVDLALANGKLRGIDVAALFASSGQGWTLVFPPGDNAAPVGMDIAVKTNLTDGIVQLDKADISMGGVAISVSGAIDLLRQHVALVAKPAGETASLPAAIKIAGGWQAPQIGAALNAEPVLRLLGRAIDDKGLDKIGKKAKKSLKKLLGN